MKRRRGESADEEPKERTNDVHRTESEARNKSKKNKRKENRNSLEREDK